MRTRRVVFFVIAASAGASLAAAPFVGCANSSTSGQAVDAAGDVTNDAVSDAGAADASDASDAKPDVGFAGVKCPNDPCEPGESCCAVNGAAGPELTCISGSSCGDGGFTIGCDGPEDCASDPLNPICCGSLSVGQGQAPACPVESVSASCLSRCDTSLAQACPAQSTVRLCHSSSECTEATYTKCCAFTQGSVTARFCVDDNTSQFSASCL